MITVSFTALTTIVQDREQKIDYDISTTPMKQWQIILSYFTASTLTTFLISLLILGVGIFGFSLEGNLYLSIWNLFELCGITLLESISATSLFMPIMLLFSTVSASSAFFGILSAAVGFLIGAYIPLSQFSTGIQTLCNIFPGSGITILFRNILMHGVLNEIDRTIDGINQGAFINSIEDTFCFQTNLFGHSLDCKFLICYIIVIVMVSLVAMSGRSAKV
ncbi:MAG: ABC transporter permease [Ruminococcus sp.]|nr:ABC transporter permease [Ruminococcus sp.]